MTNRGIAFAATPLLLRGFMLATAMATKSSRILAAGGLIYTCATGAAESSGKARSKLLDKTLIGSDLTKNSFRHQSPFSKMTCYEGAFPASEPNNGIAVTAFFNVSISKCV
jgi:hypothetical protein